MSRHFFRNTIFFAIGSLFSLSAIAQIVTEPKAVEEWSRPCQPFRIAGNLYYVGTYDLACYLVSTKEGSVLINTGLASSASQIKTNIETLGFRFSDVKILLTTQAHYDHVGALAAIKKMTGARLMVDEKEVEVLASGGSSDYALGSYGRSFEPVKPDRLLQDGDTVMLGGVQIVMLHHPGHTKGSCSFLFNVNDEQSSYKVLIANMPSIVTRDKFSDIPAYPAIAEDYAHTFEAMRKLSFDIWVASHASQFKLHDKHKPGTAYNPAAFIDRAGYQSTLNALQKEYDKKIKMDRSVLTN
ncbi:MAG TPA: subclass B3 metallo-beta-lactamase [Chryseolinea sp.]|nr:subclass B3 metallo-beta-lactamase [Chryseolinea sp.]